MSQDAPPAPCQKFMSSLVPVGSFRSVCRTVLPPDVVGIHDVAPRLRHPLVVLAQDCPPARLDLEMVVGHVLLYLVAAGPPRSAPLPILDFGLYTLANPWKGGSDDGRGEEGEVQRRSVDLRRPPRIVGRQHPGSSGSGRRHPGDGGRRRQGDSAATVQLLRLREKLRLRPGKCGLAC